MLYGKNRRSGQTASGVARSLRLGVTGLLLAGTALAPAAAVPLDLGGLTVTRTDLTGITLVTNGILRINPVPAFTYGGAFADGSGTFSLTKIGANTLTLTGSGLNTYSGITTVSAGLLEAGAANVLSPNSVVRIDSGLLDIGGFDQVLAGLAGNGQLQNSGGSATLTVSASGSYIHRGIISGDTRIVMNGVGRQTFSGASTYFGGTVLNSGTLIYGNSQAFGGGTVTVAGAASLEAGLLGLDLANNIILNADLTAMLGAATTWSGDISGGVGNQLVKTGNLVLTLTGNNSFAGGVDFQRGQINVGSDTALGGGPVTTTARMVTLGTDGNVSVALSNVFVLGGILNFELPNAANALTLNGSISGVTGGLYLKTGDGTLILNGANAYNGGTNLASGVLGLGNNNAAGTGAIRASGTGALAAYGNVAIANAIGTSNNTVVDTRGFDMALNGVIRNDSGGPGGIEKVGAGTLTLSAANLYTAGTFVNGGTLNVDGSITSNVFVVSGATFGGTGSVASANTVNVASGGIVDPGTAGSAGTLTVGNLFLASGSIFDVDLSTPATLGSGVNDLIIVTNNATLDGATINVAALPGFTSGTYRVLTANTISPGALLTAGLAPPTFAFTIDIGSNYVDLLVAESAVGPVQYWDGGDLVANGSVAGGPGTWNVANTNWTNATGSANAAWGGGTGIFQTVGGAVTVVGTQLFENLTFQVDGYVLSAGGNLQTDGSTLAVAGIANTATINSTLVGTNGIVKTGSGNLALNAANGFTGNTSIQGGTVTVGNNGALSGGSISLGNNTTLAAGVSGLVLANDIATVGNGIVDSGAGVFTLGGAISGAGSISQIGTGNLILNGNNSFSNLGINSGTVTVGTNTAAGIGGISLNNNATLAAGVSGLVLTNGIQTTASGIVDSGPGVFTLNGDIGGAGSITKAGAGNLVLGGNNSFVNLGISQGTLTVGTDTAAGSGGISMASNTTLAAGANGLALANGISTAGNGIVDAGGVGNVFTLNGDISGPGSISQVGLGTLVLTGDNSFVNLGINQGTVAVTQAAALGIGSVNIAAPATLRTDAAMTITNDITGVGIAYNIDTNGNDVTITGSVSGGGLDKEGAGTLTLANAVNAQPGILLVNGGTLNVTGGVQGGVTVSSGAALSGNGTITGNVFINGGANLNPGTSPGTLTITGNLVLAGTSNSNFELGAANTIGGAFNDLVIVGGNLTLNGNLNVTEPTGGSFGLGAYQLFQYGGTLSGPGFATVSLPPSGYTGLVQTAINGQVNLLVLSSASTLVQYWDGADFIGGVPGEIDGGTGTWSAAGTNWTGAAPSEINSNWQPGSVGVFTTVGGTVTLTDTFVAEGLQFAVDGYTLTGGELDIAANMYVSTALGVTTTIDSLISGAGVLTKQGDGTLVLNAANTYSAGTDIQDGTVVVGNNTALGGGAVTLGGNTTLAAGVDGLVLANAITTTANGIVDNNGFTFTLNGDIDGAGSISSIGLGNLVLNGNNSFTNLGINQGTVTVGTNTAAGIGSIAINNNATLAAGVDGLVLANGITTTANGIVDNSGFTFTLNGDIDGAGSISSIGLGTLVLNGNNSFTNLGINQGTVIVGTDTAAGIGAIAINNNTTLAAGVDGLVLANAITTTANGIVDNNGFTFTLNGDIDGAGSISSIGLGNLVLNGNNSFTNLGINQGTVTVGTDTAAGIGAIAINNNATLAAGANGLVIANAITTTANGIVNAGGAGNVFTLNGVIDGAGSISQVGLGNLVLNGANTFTNLGINQGTVTVGTDTAAGIGAIAINNNATLAAGVSGLVLTNSIQTTANGIVDSGPGVFTLNGEIIGPGSISQVGTGNLVLNGNNSFTNLGINRGTVTVGTNTAAGIGAIAINNNTTLAAGANGLVLANAITTTANGFINTGLAGWVFTLNGDIGGAGSITQTGLGSLVLNGNNSFSGGYTIGAGGTLTVGSNTAAGTGTITLNNNSTLAAGVSGLTLANPIVTLASGFIDSGAGTFGLSGPISGAGSLTKTGTGTLTLTGANSFAGGLNISTGTVVGSVASVGTGPIANNGALVFNQGVDATFGQVISGTGSMTKSGVGALTLSAVNTMSGPTTVSAGRLIVTGGLGSSATTVQTGASLWGTAPVGALTVQAGGTVAPGAVALQSGTLTVNGALTLASGSTLVIDAGSDLLRATGTATIAGNLVVNPVGTGFRFGEQTIVSSSGRTGQFASTSFTGGFGPAITAAIGYTAASVILELNPTSLVAAGGSSLSPNSFEVASAFDTAVANGYDANPFFALYNQGSNLNNALLQLSGELHSAERRVLLEDTRIVRETAFDRLNTGLAAIAGNQQVTSDVNGGDFTFWLRGAGSWGSANADGIGSDFNTSQWGVLTGVDYAKDGFKVGAMFHYTSTDVTFDDASLGRSTVETTGGAIYGGYRSDAGWAVGIGGSYAGNSANGNRAVTAPGLAQTLDSSISGTTYQVFGEIAYDFIAAPELRVEPFGRIAYAGIDSNDFLEVGGIGAIEADKQSNDLTIFNLGLRAAYDVGAIRVSGSASWQNTSGDRSGGVTSSITGLNSPMFIQAVALDGDAANLEAQVSYGFTDKIRLGVGYSGLIGGNNSDNGVRATLSVGF